MWPREDCPPEGIKARANLLGVMAVDHCGWASASADGKYPEKL